MRRQQLHNHRMTAPNGCALGAVLVSSAEAAECMASVRRLVRNPRRDGVDVRAELTKQLLEKGYNVRGTVRDRTDTAKVKKHSLRTSWQIACLILNPREHSSGAAFVRCHLECSKCRLQPPAWLSPSRLLLRCAGCPSAGTWQSAARHVGAVGRRPRRRRQFRSSSEVAACHCNQLVILLGYC